jgi:protein-S-isoprenylcysteine O-methyltransferase Ste14
MNALEHRIPPPIVVIIFGAGMWLASCYTPLWLPDTVFRLALTALITVVGLAFGGGGLRAFVKAKTTIDPVHVDAASALVTDGVFRISRNPMYVGFALLLTAWAVYLAAPWTLLGVATFVLFIRRFQILPEERAMKEKFGLSYEEYRRRVRRWL